MDQVLQNFISVLRESGVPVSISETLDAAHALEIVGYGDRKVLKDSLGSSLAKSAREREVFDRCFDQYFTLEMPSVETASDRCGESAQTEFPLSPLSRMLLVGDTPGLIASMFQAARRANLESLRYPTQKAFFAMRMLDTMGSGELDRDIAQLGESGSPLPLKISADLADARRSLFESIIKFIEDRFEMLSNGTYNHLIEDYLRNSRLTHIEERDLHRMHAIIQKMVKRLNDLHSRRKRTARRGMLDFKRTLRKNITYEGYLFVPAWKTKKIERPDIIVICDISRSVSRLVRFFLLFLYSLNREVARIRSFVFCSNLTEVTEYFEKYPVEAALAVIQNGAGLDILMGRTDYGRALQDFRENGMDSLTRNTTVIILGDARSNFSDPRPDILRSISQRCKRLLWMNPEVPTFWGTGDSEMYRYSPYCTLLQECNTLNHLERIIGSLLRH
ncbi:MAG: VWA domain-containing protein [Syntrophales bacterium]|nr:VWA domain-containing protein [Syntrophales bacterium]MDD5233623.1 VWA domain-containing protein [Syntrophales bacterium]MDD5533991.1 VWA domain-containing protein [Syntrophales bacterium]HPL63602.1 VWA domain-containing protein [Syntrophales bacterium]